MEHLWNFFFVGGGLALSVKVNFFAGGPPVVAEEIHQVPLCTFMEANLNNTCT